MKDYKISKYKSSDKTEWDSFVDKAKNATFLFKRDFMDYHKDRFEDYSLLILDEKNKLVALIPANKTGTEVHSHQGLTFGGIILLAKQKVESTEIIISSLISYFKSKNISCFRLKTLTEYYNKLSSNEIDYLISKKGATIYCKEMNLAIALQNTFQVSKSKLKHYRKTCNTDISYQIENSFKPFWNNVLIPRLQEKHNTKPVHTLEEIESLAIKFPENIKQYSVYFENEIIAGITIFETEKVVKSQYGGTTDKGEKLRALDFLFIKLK
mgnify:CR=1 FL=1